SSPEASANELDRMADRFDAQLGGLNDLRNTLETRVAPALPITAKPAYQRVLSNIDESIARATELRDTFRLSAKDLRSGKKPMQQLRPTVQGVKADLGRSKDTVGDASPADTVGAMQAATAELSKNLSKRADDADTLGREIKRAGETGDLSRLARMIGNDPSLV